MEAHPFDPAQIRAVVLATALSWMTVDDIQRDVTAKREELGHKPHHVPIQIVQQTLLAMVEQGAIVSKQDPGQPLVYRIERRAVVRRRSQVLIALVSQPDQTDTAAHLCEKTGATLADLNELDGHCLISLRQTELGAVAILTQACFIELVERGAETVVADRMPSEDKAVGEEFARQAVALLTVERERAKQAETKFSRLKLWLAANGVHNIDGIIEPAVAKPGKTVFDHTETRKIDDAENGRILKEILVLERQRGIVELRVNEAKSAGKADIEKIDGEISVLKSFSQGSERIISTLAYKEIDFAKGVVLIRACSDDRELKREPIPRGTQKPLEFTAPKELPPPPDPTAPRADLTDLTKACCDVLRHAGEEVLTLGEIVAQVQARFDVKLSAEDLEADAKLELGKLVKAKVVKKVRGAFVLAENVAPPVEAQPTVAGETDSEPGPLADPERRRRGKKAPGGEAHP